jgi:FMN phosphatase YigB (HAD superfamily)
MNRFNDKPIVGLDIDGTLGDYHGHFLRFAEQWYGRPMPDPSINTDGVPLFKLMKTSKATYRDCKLAFRQGGMKRSMPAYPNASELTYSLRVSGAEVWIATTRPYLRLDNIDPDTRHWLRRNRIQHDGIIYGEHKYRDLKRYFGERVLFVVDDLPEMVEVARSIGLDAVLRDQPYNRSWAALNPDVPVVYSMADIAEYYVDKRGF